MQKIKSIARLFVAAILLANLLLLALPAHKAAAAQITTRSLLLQAGASAGGSKPGGTVQHLFTFTLPTSGNVGSIKFEYCTLAAGTCTMPTGLNTTGSSMGSQSGAIGFSLDNSTPGAPFIHRPTASITGPQIVSYQLLDVVNPNVPSTPNYSFYVRITTYASEDTTGTPTDAGTVTASTADPIVLTGIMPESLVFCTGATVGVNGASVPDCSTATSGAVSFNQLFSATDTATATSQMAASTNAGAGYVITVNGATLTSGSNTINALAAPTASLKGVSQFGMNLRANTTGASNPAIGAEVSPSANASNYRGQAFTNYDTVDTFTYGDGNIVANSANGGAGGTDAQIFTVSYIVNVPGSQPAGTYTTTLTYICTPTF